MLNDYADYLKCKGFSVKAVSAILGNAMAESNLEPANVENVSEIADSVYTMGVDKGTRNFLDGFGYGLFQWTYPSRKKKLLDLAKERKTSVSDWKLQLDYMCMELVEDFPGVYDVLMAESNTLEYMTEIFMKRFENPSSQTTQAVLKRINFAKDICGKIAQTENVSHETISGTLEIAGKRYKIRGVLNG